jgi:hypothetical protein
MPKINKMTKNNWKLRLGISLMILSGFVFGSLLIIPFLNIDSKIKITATTVIIVIGEITFWSGGLLVGKEMLTKYKSYLNPKNWFKKKLEKVDN